MIVEELVYRVSIEEYRDDKEDLMQVPSFIANQIEKDLKELYQKVRFSCCGRQWDRVVYHIKIGEKEYKIIIEN